MRRVNFKMIAVVTVSALALSACGKPEVKTGNLVQRFKMVDDAGVHFGVVELDPISGGSIIDVQGRVVGQIVPPSQTAFAMAPLPQVPVAQ